MKAEVKADSGSSAPKGGSQTFQRIDYDREHELATLPGESKDVIVVSTGFDPGDKHVEHSPRASQLAANSVHLLQQSARVLRFGGLLFIYGLPPELAVWGERSAAMRDDAQQLIFKYWIALDLDDAANGDFLKPTHQGLLLYLKTHADRKMAAPLRLNTAAARVPHAFCAACGLNVKDWGGKKHLMNPQGAAPSDVWRDLPRRPLCDSVIPEDVLNRIALLTDAEAGNCLHVVQKSRAVEVADVGSDHVLSTANSNREPTPNPSQEGNSDRVFDDRVPSWEGSQVDKLASSETNRVYLGDCVSFLKKIKALHPHGVFDLAFADPPYNLQKSYDSYADTLAEQHYLKWCNAWLAGMVETLKPGGSLLILNLPKWAIHHAAFLSRHLEFRHWIVWDALSDPRGKLMPAHYALLYYTKPGGKPVFNYAPASQRSGDSAERRHPGHKESMALCRGAATETADFVVPPDSPKYCLRAACIKQRKARGDDEKVELTDVWFDIHRIKHKRDRDAHPCQLPEKLMERIIRLTTRPGDVVFDPFCGAGTTAIAATRLGRKFVVVDVDPNYARITNEKLAAMKQNADLFGTFAVTRASVARPRAAGSKRGIELYLQNLARKLGRVPTEDDVGADRPEVLGQIDLTYPTRSAAFKRARVVLEKPA